MTVLPYKNKTSGKKEQVAVMFDNIAHRYDFLNHFLSMGIDILWRRKAIKLFKNKKYEYLLDIATGTGDFAIEASKLNPTSIIGVDISEGMLENGRKKLKNKKLDNLIQFQKADSENLPFDTNHFDGIMCSFGVRNFENLEKGIGEMYRVLKPEGKTVIIEFSQPEKFPIKQLYSFYFNNILPLLGRIFSRDNAAYTYLPESVSVFPYGKSFISILQQAGFKNCLHIPLSGGIAAIYVGEK